MYRHSRWPFKLPLQPCYSYQQNETAAWWLPWRHMKYNIFISAIYYSYEMLVLLFPFEFVDFLKIIIIHSGFKMSVNSEKKSKWRLQTSCYWPTVDSVHRRWWFSHFLFSFSWKVTQTLLIYIQSTNQFIISALPVTDLSLF